MAAFSQELVARVDELATRYPEKKAALLPAMHLIQAERGGWFSDETIRDTAELFDVPDVHVRGMVGFYDMLEWLHGDDPWVDNGETTEDGRFTFKCFECLGHCSTAPMLLVDEEKYEDLTVAKLDDVLRGLA